MLFQDATSLKNTKETFTNCLNLINFRAYELLLNEPIIYYKCLNHIKLMTLEQKYDYLTKQFEYRFCDEISFTDKIITIKF